MPATLRRAVAATIALVALSIGGLAAARSWSSTAAGPPPPAGPLLREASLVYRGAFALPTSPRDQESFNYGGTALAYNPAGRSLFVVGHDWYQLTAEVAIPALVKGAQIANLNTAELVQPFADATSGTIKRAGGEAKIGGQLVYRGRLYGTAYVYYDASGSQVVSHWARPSTSLTAGRAAGLYRVGRIGTGMVSGYLATVPTAWAPLLGGPALTGNCCIPIISRTSFGPAAFVFDPVDLGKKTPAPATPLVYYPDAHPTIGRWDATWNPARGVLFNGTTSIRGLVFPTGSRSILFFGTQGTGKFCYGEGSNDRSRAGRPTPDGSVYCYDPDDSSKGTHGYPYVAKVWAYKVADLLAVKRGGKKPWQVRPYATWSLRLPFGSGRIGGAAYDSASGLVYVSQQFADGSQPVIHAFELR